ncbi:MAG: hypothetical protein ACREE7_02955, partial [Dongiaceae bacterium]
MQHDAADGAEAGGFGLGDLSGLDGKLFSAGAYLGVRRDAGEAPAVRINAQGAEFFELGAAIGDLVAHGSVFIPASRPPDVA